MSPENIHTPPTDGSSDQTPPPPPRNLGSRGVMYNPPPTPQEFGGGGKWGDGGYVSSLHVSLCIFILYINRLYIGDVPKA